MSQTRTSYSGISGRLPWGAPLGAVWVVARGESRLEERVPRRRGPARVAGLLAIAALASAPDHGAASAISTGDEHTCAVIAGGGVRCWGDNHWGQLGAGTGPNRLTAVDVPGLTSGVAAIAAGGVHTCALTIAGGVKCWGYNTWGEIGDGTGTSGKRTPTDVLGLTSGVAAIVAGKYAHTCALTTGGGVKCWGYNFYGGLGDGTTTNRPAPVDVTGLASDVTAIAAGSDHSCAVTVGGEVMCWGRNSEGQLGDGTTTQRLTAVDVSGLSSGVAAIAAGGFHTCALTTGGGVKCWGANGYGQLGDGTTTDRLTAVDVTGLTSGAAAIAPGASHTCALTSAGGVKCWGVNFDGQLGDGTTTHRLTAVDVSGLTSGVVAIAADVRHTCALTSAGGGKCWGESYYGSLGDGTTRRRVTAADVVGLPVAAAVIGAAGGTLTTPDGRVTLEIPPGSVGEPTTFHLTQGAAKSEVGAGSTTKNLVTLVDVAPSDVTFPGTMTLTFAWPDASPDDGKVDGTTIREKTLRVFRDGVVAPGTTRCDLQACTIAACCDMAANTWTVQTTELGEWAVGTEPCVETSTPKLLLTKLAPPGGDDRLKFSGTLSLLGSGSVADQLDVVNQGIVLRLVDGRAVVRQTPEGDAVALDVEVPGGAYDSLTRVGWKVSKAKRWTWFGPKVGSLAGIRKLALREVGNVPGGVRFSVKGDGGAYLEGPYFEWDGINPALALPDSGQCYEAVFSGSNSCKIDQGLVLGHFVPLAVRCY